MVSGLLQVLLAQRRRGTANLVLGALQVKHLLLVLALTAAACSPSSLASTVGHQVPQTVRATACRDTFVQSLTSTTPVHGAFTCLDAKMQRFATAHGVKGDADLAKNATVRPIYSGIHLLGRGAAGADEYRMLIDGAPAFLFIWTASDGRISGVQILAS